MITNTKKILSIFFILFYCSYNIVSANDHYIFNNIEKAQKIYSKNPSKAHELVDEGIKYYEENKSVFFSEDYPWLGYFYSAKAGFLNKEGKYKSAATYRLKACEQHKKKYGKVKENNQKSSYVICLYMLGSDYSRIKNYEKTIDIASEALKIYESFENYYINDYSNIFKYISVLYQRADAYDKLYKYKDALNDYKKSNKLVLKFKLKTQEAIDAYLYSLGRLSGIYAILGDTKNEFKYLKLELDTTNKYRKNEKEKIGILLHAIAAIHFQNDDLLKALNAIDQAVNLLTEVSQKPNLVSDEKASVLTYLSLALSKKLDIISIINPDNTKMGPELGKKLLAINDQLELKDKMIIPYQHLINFYVGKNQHKKVKSLFRDAYILVNKQIVDARNKKSWLLKYKLSSIRKLKKDEAYYYLSLSDWNRSLEIADELKAYEKDDLSAFEIHEKTDLLNLYGLIYRGLGKKKLAIKYFLNALDILNKAHKKSLDQETTLLSNLALAYQDIGNYKLANKYINEVGERVQMQSGHELYKVKTYNNIAAISTDMNIKEKYLLKSYDVYENNSGIIDKDLGYVNTITLLTEYHVYKQDYKTAEKYLLKAHDYVLKNMDKNIFKFGTYLYFYSDLIAINHQDYDACIYFSKKYTDALEKINNKSSELIKFYSHIAICHYKKNEKEIYFDYLYKMMSILINEFEQNNLNLTFEVSDTIKKNKKYVHFFINSVMEFSHNNPEILNKYSDINFHDLIFVLQQMIKANKLSINLSQAISREMSKNDEISLIIKQYSNLIDKRKNLMNISSWSKKYIERINEELKQTDMTISKLKTKIYEVYPDFEKNFTHQIISASMLQNTIDDGQAVIQISVGKYSSIVSVISKENYKIYRLKNADKKNIKSLVKNIRDSIQLENNLPKKFDKNSSSELYKILFDDRIKKILEHKEKLIIIPDGPLYSIPYELLFDNDSDKWLVEKYAITVYPSIYSFSALNNNIAFNKSNSFLGLGNPKIQDDRVADNSKFLKDAELEFSNIFTRGGSVDLKYLKLFPELPETEVELKRIASKFDNNSKLYLRERFNEKQLKKINFSNFKVVNFATHALVVGEIDGLSEPAIVLSLPKKISDHDDGLLTAKEIIKMKLNNDLIILSACNTASSDGSSSGEALSGLANSFFYSGARSLLVTHWAIISDTSVDLVSDTFDFLNESDGDLSIALRKSKIKMLKNPKTSHPIYWAPYTLVGRSKLNSL